MTFAINKQASARPKLQAGTRLSKGWTPCHLKSESGEATGTGSYASCLYHLDLVSGSGPGISESTAPGAIRMFVPRKYNRILAYVRRYSAMNGPALRGLGRLMSLACVVELMCASNLRFRTSSTDCIPNIAYETDGHGQCGQRRNEMSWSKRHALLRSWS